MQVIIKENQKKCNYKGQGASSFFSTKCPEENLILKITSTIKLRREYMKRCVILKLNLILNLSGPGAFYPYF